MLLIQWQRVRRVDALGGYNCRHRAAQVFEKTGRFRLRFTTFCGRDLVDVCHGFAYVCVIAPRGNFIRGNEFTHQRDVVGFTF